MAHKEITKNTPKTQNLSYFNCLISKGYEYSWQIKPKDKIAKLFTLLGKNYLFAHSSFNYLMTINYVNATSHL